MPQGLCIIGESYVEKVPPFVMLERSEASCHAGAKRSISGWGKSTEKNPCHPEILRRPDNS